MSCDVPQLTPPSVGGDSGIPRRTQTVELTMRKYAIGLAVGAALVVGAVAIAGDKAEEEAARKDILDVAKAIEDGKGAKAIQAKVKAIKAKGYELDVLMLVYKTKQKGGLGFGEKPA